MSTNEPDPDAAILRGQVRKVPTKVGWEGMSPNGTRSECCRNDVEWVGHEAKPSTRSTEMVN